MSDIVWYRYGAEEVEFECQDEVRTRPAWPRRAMAVLPEHPGDPQASTMLAFVPSGDGEWDLITTTFDVVLATTRDAFRHEIKGLPRWLAKQGYDVEPRRFSREDVDAERWRRARLEYY